MDKYVISDLTRDKAKSFSVVEPFDGSSFLFSHFLYSLICVILGEAARAKQKKTTQSPQVWAIFDITAKTYFVLLGDIIPYCCKIVKRQRRGEKQENSQEQVTLQHPTWREFADWKRGIIQLATMLPASR